MHKKIFRDTKLSPEIITLIKAGDITKIISPKWSPEIETTKLN